MSLHRPCFIIMTISHDGRKNSVTWHAATPIFKPDKKVAKFLLFTLLRLQKVQIRLLCVSFYLHSVTCMNHKLLTPPLKLTSSHCISMAWIQVLHVEVHIKEPKTNDTCLPNFNLFQSIQQRGCYHSYQLIHTFNTLSFWWSENTYSSLEVNFVDLTSIATC